MPTPQQRLLTLESPSGMWELRTVLDQLHRPCIAYHVPGFAGGSCMLAAGRRGCWAVETTVIGGGSRERLLVGATAPEVRRVAYRLTDGTVLRIRPTSEVRHGLRYFAKFLAPDAEPVVNAAEGFDALGRLLGGEHNNDGHGGSGRRHERYARLCHG